MGVTTRAGRRARAREAPPPGEAEPPPRPPAADAAADAAAYPGLPRLALAALGLKLLLAHPDAYRSTDFEVHRNWLAVTASLPLGEWYVDATSEWTLDYPPLFAWFERGLAALAPLADPAMLGVENLGHASAATVLFQRATVAASELALAAAVAACVRRHRLRGNRATFAVAASLLSPGVLLVDHVHFQYNGMLLGLLVASGLLLQTGRHDLLGGVAFAALLNLKHLFLYAAPWYFLFLLRAHVLAAPTPRRAAARLAALGAAVAGVFAASFGPFAARGQLPQVFRRLFPFGRGLLHAYWAPNCWALWAGADKALAAAARLAGRAPGGAAGANLVGGLVQATRFAVLPDVGPGACLGAVLLALAPCLLRAWRRPARRDVLCTLAYINLCGFMFGYHVHEKAVLTFAVPFGLHACLEPALLEEYFLMATSAYAGLLPLLFRPQEYGLKVLLVLAHLVAAHRMAAGPGTGGGTGKGKGGGGGGAPPRGAVERLRRLHAYGFLAVELYCGLGHRLAFGNALEFLPLMLTSVYAAAGLAAHFAWMCRREWALALAD